MSDVLSALARFAVRIDHLAIAVPDLDSSLAFYQMLGFSLIERRTTDGKDTGMASAVLAANGIIVVLVQGFSTGSQVNRYIERYGAGVQHVAIEVRDVKKLLQELQARQVPFATRVIQGKEILQIFTARDPSSGMMFEFVERQSNDGNFTDESVRELFLQLEANEAY